MLCIGSLLSIRFSAANFSRYALSSSSGLLRKQMSISFLRLLRETCGDLPICVQLHQTLNFSFHCEFLRYRNIYLQKLCNLRCQSSAPYLELSSTEKFREENALRFPGKSWTGLK